MGLGMELAPHPAAPLLGTQRHGILRSLWDILAGVPLCFY